jgi:hypothetical protein
MSNQSLQANDHAVTADASGVFSVVVIAELKRSAELFGIVFAWFQFSELFSTSFSFRKDYRPSW